ncbi:hypothetical protein GCM10010441_11010 [Kitasatospora paracochleata]|uniref:Secreted protein n=1 Tax=Kitasatospora paracochleata TaxID=58354 RepID=A0ABT1J2T9_9ACTN|nr:hypothetical protein [Kitasatospora paracochleata]MCP2311474.1 hypothetical protein [Kitasatospora paracochleata]
MKLRLAASSAVIALVATAGLFSAGTASANTTGRVCRNPDVSADGLNVHTCISGDGGRTLTATADTSGGNNTTINLCVKVVDGSQHDVPGSENCAWGVNGPHGHVSSNPVTVPYGTYYAVSYFTSPTYWYGGESRPISVFPPCPRCV